VLDQRVGERTIREMVDSARLAGAPVTVDDGRIAVLVRPGVTQTLGGIQIDEHARVLGVDNLFAAGADVGGISTGGYSSGLAAAMLALRHVRGKDNADRRAAVGAGFHLDRAAQRAGALLDLVVARAPPLTRAVVRDHGLDPPLARRHADRDPVRRPAAERLVHGLAADLVEPDPRVLRQAVRRVDVEVDLD